MIHGEACSLDTTWAHISGKRTYINLRTVFHVYFRLLLAFGSGPRNCKRNYVGRLRAWLRWGGAVYIDRPQHLGIWGNSVGGRCNTLFIVELRGGRPPSSAVTSFPINFYEFYEKWLDRAQVVNQSPRLVMFNFSGNWFRNGLETHVIVLWAPGPASQPI